MVVNDVCVCTNPIPIIKLDWNNVIVNIVKIVLHIISINTYRIGPKPVNELLTISSHAKKMHENRQKEKKNATLSKGPFM